MIKIETIGAGGGSIAWIDSGGALKVGPQSAGASPGPVCYSQGGTERTVTDAHLLLGRLTREGLLGGRLHLDADLARQAFQERVCRPLDLDLVDAASGVIRIANVLMAEAIRLQTVNKGLDPRDFVLLAFGGAGPLHACEIAAELGIDRVIAPPSPGVLSAFGLAGADAKTGVVRAVNRSVGELTATELRELYSSLDDQCQQVLNREEVDPADRILTHSADLRYEEQSFEITVPVVNGFDRETELTLLSEAFHRSHRDLYGYSIPEHTPFLVNVEVTAIGRKPKPRTPPLASFVSPVAPVATRPVFFIDPHGFADAAIYARNTLLAGHSLQGPAVVEQFDSTVVVPPGWQARADEFGSLILARDL